MLGTDSDDKITPSCVNDKVSWVGTSMMKDAAPANRMDVAVKFDPGALDAEIGVNETSTKFSNNIDLFI